jgi:hypothetical protein
VTLLEEEEGLHGVHRQLRRNEHQKTKEGCKKFSGKQAVNGSVTLLSTVTV